MSVAQASLAQTRQAVEARCEADGLLDPGGVAALRGLKYRQSAATWCRRVELSPVERIPGLGADRVLFDVETDPNDPATDYDRACDVNYYLGLIEIGAGKGLVLGGEPLSTAWWPSGSLGNEDGHAPGNLVVDGERAVRLEVEERDAAPGADAVDLGAQRAVPRARTCRRGGTG